VQPYVWWIVIAIALVTVELLTGTFYLLVLGVAAAGGAALAYFAMPFWVQAGFATAIAALGVVLVHHYRAANPSITGSNAIDIGQRVTLESWINEAEGLARVHYRGTLWDAKVAGPRASGTTYYIRGVDGSTLHIGTERL